MSEHKLLEMINIYFDGELAKSEEASLFSLLASDQTARDYFKQLSVIRNAVDNYAEDFPAELEVMNEDFSEVFVLKEYSGLSYKEIASLLEIDEDLVKSRLYKARQKLISKISKVLQ
jgi:RNA polymerase sigma factor (sigma-70 family)